MSTVLPAAQIAAKLERLREEETALLANDPILAPLFERKVRLNHLVERLKNGEDVASRELQVALHESEFADYKAMWAWEMERRADAKNKPKEIVEYEKRLAKAVFEYNRAEGYFHGKKRKTRTGSDGRTSHRRAYARSETLCENLLTYLEESVTRDPSLQDWFDRPLVFGAAGNLSLTPAGMPWVITSRSPYRMNVQQVTARSKREVKLDALQQAANTLDMEIERYRRALELKAEEERKENTDAIEALKGLRQHISRLE